MRPYRRFIFVSLLLLAVALCFAPAALAQEVQPPAINAAAAYIVNADNGDVIYSSNQDVSRAMASTTKMMTALIIVENCKNLDEKVTISKRAAETGESSIWLEEGEVLTVRELLAGLLIQSGNDAAIALAEYQAGSVEAFVEMMNNRAAELGLQNTHFSNPHGLDDEQHYSSAADLARLGKEVMKHQLIRDYVDTTVTSISKGDNPNGRTLINHNHLLEQSPLVHGIKTGYTDAAGQCIVIFASDRGINMIISYMGGPSLSQRDQDILAMIDYGFNCYQEKAVISGNVEYTQVNVPFHNDKKMALVSEKDLVTEININNEIEYRYVLPEDLTLPIQRGDRLGLVEAYEGNTYLGSTYLIATEDVPNPGLTGRIVYYLQFIYHLFLSTSLFD